MVASRRWVKNRQEQGPDVDQLLWAHEVAHVLGVGRNRAYLLMSSGEIPSIRIGRSIWVRREALDEWIEQQEQPTEAGVA